MQSVLVVAGHTREEAICLSSQHHCSPQSSVHKRWCWLRKSALCILVQVRDSLHSHCVPLCRCCKRACIFLYSGRIREGSDILQCHYCRAADGARERRSGELSCVSTRACPHPSLDPRLYSSIVREGDREALCPCYSSFRKSLTTTKSTARVSSSDPSTTSGPAESQDG